MPLDNIENALSRAAWVERHERSACFQNRKKGCDGGERAFEEDAGERAFFNLSSGEPVAKRIGPCIEAGVGQPLRAAPEGEKARLFRGQNLKPINIDSKMANKY